MTVTTTAAALLAWAFAISLFFNWFWFGKLDHYRDAYKLELEINGHNARHFQFIETTLINDVLEIANVTALPTLDIAKFAKLVELYDAPDLKPYRIPAAKTTCQVGGTIFYWSVADVNELEAHEIARLWLAGVL